MNAQQELLLKKYVEAVLSAPSHLHLTADRDFDLFWKRHILDAESILATIPPVYKEGPRRVLDVGSGNGIPGIPFSILEPQWTVEMLDSDNKKCGFIESFYSSNAIINAHVTPSRAESMAHTKMRESYDIVVSRALSKLRVAIELCAAFVKVGGVLVVPHGTSWEREFGDNADSLDVLGLDMPNPIPYKLGEVEFTLVTFEKISPTPREYPRAVGIPSKRPL